MKREAGADALRVAQENIRTVAQIEEEVRTARSSTERVADRIADFTGSISFAVLHLVGFSIWVLVNSGKVKFIRPFDPFPFILLSLVVSCEAVLLSTFVLIKQNRMSRAADQRTHLNLQIDLLAEREITKMLQMQRLICEQLGIEEAVRDPEARQMSAETAVETLATEVKRSIPAE